VIVMTNRPGSIKSVVDIELPRPRNVLDMQSNEVFFETRSRIWMALREEVLTLRARESQADARA
jgi:NitT/TauT family transport system ATP-binding protein